MRGTTPQTSAISRPCLRDKRSKHSGDVVVAKMNRRIGKQAKALRWLGGCTLPHRDARRKDADRARIGVYYPIIDLTGAVWFERSGFSVGGC